MRGSSFLPEGGVDSALPTQAARYLQVAKRVDVVGQHGHGQRLQQVEERRADGRCAGRWEWSTWFVSHLSFMLFEISQLYKKKQLQRYTHTHTCTYTYI